MMTPDGRIGQPKHGRIEHSENGIRIVAVVLTTAIFCGALALAQDGGGAPAPSEGVGTEGKACLDCHGDLLERKRVHGPVKEGCGKCHVQSGRRHEFAAIEPERACSPCHELALEAQVHAPVKEHACSTCHDPHSADRAGLLRAPEQELCGTCHDELKGERKKHVHGPFAVGVCQVCHASHSSKSPKLLREPGKELCLGCHEHVLPDDAAAVRWHGPAEDDCTLCHSGHESDAAGILKVEQPKLCLTCHRSIRETMETSPVKHAPVAEEGGCGNCHEPHFSKYASLLKSDSADLCLTCHDREYPQEGGRPFPSMTELLAANPNHHGPVREKDCEGCHEPHGSRYTRLLKADYPPTFYAPFDVANFALCFTCHPSELALEAGFSATNFRDGERNLHFIHVNRKKGRTCRACHETHASRLPHHIRETTPFGDWDLPIGFEETATGGSCAPGCHTSMSYGGGK